jgi:hypothetical protein
VMREAVRVALAIEGPARVSPLAPQLPALLPQAGSEGGLPAVGEMPQPFPIRLAGPDGRNRLDASVQECDPAAAVGNLNEPLSKGGSAELLTRVHVG